MKIILYFTFSFSFMFLSFMVGMILTFLVRKSSLYQNKLSNLNFITNENLNKFLGVNLLKWIVKNTFFKYLNQNLKMNKSFKVLDLNQIRSEMTKAEIGHLFGFFFVTPFIVYKFINQEYLFAIILLLLNILMNLCPTLLQQQNKRRIDQLINRFNSK